MPPRGLDPRGLILVDKPAGPSSFEVIARVRRRTQARTGHAGTLDPFASGLLLVLSGAATRLAPWLVGLDKRYLTDVDLSARTSTGDVEGEVVERSEPPGPEELEQRLAGLRGEVELRIPAASAVKIGGERAYKLHRRGEEVEMPVRRSYRLARPDRLHRWHREPRPVRRQRDLRPRDRRGARRPLPHAAAHRGWPLLG
jgi:tRNA pseudouridine55 synthase